MNNEYVIDNALVRVVRRETTHTLLRNPNTGDTRWIANELLAHMLRADEPVIHAGNSALLCGPNAGYILAVLIGNHRRLGAATLISLSGKPIVANTGELFYNSPQYDNSQVRGFLKANLAVAVRWDDGRPDARLASKFDTVLS